MNFNVAVQWGATRTVVAMCPEHVAAAVQDETFATRALRAIFKTRTRATCFACAFAHD